MNGIRQLLLEHFSSDNQGGLNLFRMIYHGLFWIIFLVVLVVADGIILHGVKNWSFELINLFFYAVIVYYNLLYLIPNYLSKKRFLTYLGLLVAVTLVITCLRFIIFQLSFGDQLLTEEKMVANLGFYLPMSFAIAGGSTIFKIINDWFRQQRDKQDLETQTMQSELRFLKSQINPHFLFNTLNNLYALTLKKSDKAPEIVIKLSEMMRYMLYECNEKRVPLSKEVNYLKNYLDLERLRQHASIRINLIVEGNIGHQQIAPLIFIPFLENGFKHGLNTQLREGFVDIELRVADDFVDFRMENSKGEAMPRPDNRPSGGIGLVNVRRRLDLLYPEKYNLQVNNNPNTFEVRLSLEL